MPEGRSDPIQPGKATNPRCRESPRPKKIDEALLRLLEFDLQPATIVEDKGFLIFLQVVDPK